MKIFLLEKELGPWVKNAQGNVAPGIRSVDFDDQSQNRASFSSFVQWLQAVDSGADVEHFATLLEPIRPSSVDLAKETAAPDAAGPANILPQPAAIGAY